MGTRLLWNTCLRSSTKLSRFSVTLGIKLKQVEIRSSNFPINLQNSFDSRCQSICLEGVTLVPSLYSIETRIIMQRDRWLQTIMGESEGRLISPILSNRESCGESACRNGNNSFSNSNMARTTMVPKGHYKAIFRINSYSQKQAIYC